MTRRTLVFVAAHPDDDTFAISRSIALHRSDPDLRFVLIHATDGEAGDIAADVDVMPEKLGALRRLEAAASWQTIGREPDRHVWLGFPDGGLADIGRDLFEPIREVLVEEAPDVVATFGLDGVTGHPDHIAVSRAVTEAFMMSVELGSPGFGRLLHGAIRQSHIDRWNANLSAEGRPTWDPDTPYSIRGVPDHTIGISVDTRSVSELTVAALRQHRSQWSPVHMPIADEELGKSLRTEDWVIAWPPSHDQRPVLTDIFEGI